MLRIIGVVSESAESMNFAKTAPQRAKVIVRTASLANHLKQTLNPKYIEVRKKIQLNMDKTKMKLGKK